MRAIYKSMLFYNPRGLDVSDEEKKKIIKTLKNNKTPTLTIHIIGNKDKLKEVLNYDDKDVLYPPKYKLTEDELFKMYNMRGQPRYRTFIKEIPKIRVNFYSDEDKIELGKALNIKLTKMTSFIHYPEKYESKSWDYKYITKGKSVNPQYPVYIISKGRWEQRLTQQLLEKSNIPYKIVVEPSEYDKYAEVIDEKNIIKAPEDFSKLGKGSVPVRNYVWDHAVKSGASHHWVLDDNIREFNFYNNNLRVKINNGIPLRATEDYVKKFNNVYLSGLQYSMFVPDRSIHYPYVYNTRIFSCILINHKLDNILDERWRGKYNEDVDLSLRVLLKGLGTILNQQFLISKEATLRNKGGNTDSIYGGKNDYNKIKEKAEAIIKEYPTIAKLSNKYNRGIHHTLNLNQFIDNDLGYEERKEKYKKNYNYKIVKLNVNKRLKIDLKKKLI